MRLRTRPPLPTYLPERFGGCVPLSIALMAPQLFAGPVRWASLCVRKNGSRIHVKCIPVLGRELQCAAKQLKHYHSHEFLSSDEWGLTNREVKGLRCYILFCATRGPSSALFASSRSPAARSFCAARPPVALWGFVRVHFFAVLSAPWFPPLCMHAQQHCTAICLGSVWCSRPVPSPSCGAVLGGARPCQVGAPPSRPSHLSHR